MNVGSAPGYFYMMGSDQGSCGAVMPTYFRSDMSATYWKEFYTMVILANTQQRPMECVVASESVPAATAWSGVSGSR